ncbi:Alpha/Beta hydrolase protein [Irpex rosettiformis]|uniref:Alpha/Beta hydrolase protein n=1 Tax=Irpex rosettiformis TaxID=378272 RepID=A0ACB8TN37_9APHY|nr:Alpha/Beta hydrolase protein [Irpex rosettiformis]
MNSLLSSSSLPPSIPGWSEHVLSHLSSTFEYTYTSSSYSTTASTSLPTPTTMPHPVPPAATSFNCITLTLLTLPTVILALYFLTAFPAGSAKSEGVVVYPGLASLVRGGGEGEGGGGVGGRVRAIYGEDFWERRMSCEGEEVDVEGGYVQLPLGRTRYWVVGPEDGEKLVLIHGLSVPSIIWKDVAPSLARKGYRILLYDLYGRGYTDAPLTTHTTSLYTTQLALLLQYLGPAWGKVSVVGISMGGGIAAAFCVQFPHLVTGKVALLAAAGVIEASDMSRTSRFLSSPLVQSITSSYPFRMYLKHLAQTGPSPGDGDGVAELTRIQSAHLQGYNPALASCIRDGPIRNLAPVFAQLGRVVRKRRRVGGVGGGSEAASGKASGGVGGEAASGKASGGVGGEAASGKAGGGVGSVKAGGGVKASSNSNAKHSVGGGEGWAEDSRVLLVWGTRDKVVPYHYAERVLTLVGGEVGWQERWCGEKKDEGGCGENEEGRRCEKKEEKVEVEEKDKKDKKEVLEIKSRPTGRWFSDEQHARLVTIDGAGHDLTASHPEVVVRLLDAFFDGG